MGRCVLEARKKRATFFLLAAPIVFAASGLATAACKGGPDDGRAGSDFLGGLEKSSAGEDCIADAGDDDAGCSDDVAGD